MQRYNPKEIETKWQKKWEESGIYNATEDPSKPKKYILEYFPYPSGAAMHVGHVRNYTIGDVVARFNRMNGFNVLHPMGWDGFGLPAENYAIKNQISPRVAIDQNTAKFKEQLIQMGFSYDWSREIDSTDPKYYKWTQWFFLMLFRLGLAYQQESLQWWCPFDKTVLANEQVEAGRCWRCGNEVEKKALKQWFFKITDYADRLADDLDNVDWSDAIKSMQRNWIGRSVGAEIEFKLDGHDEALKVFTTRPDTLYGATFMVLSPEHPLVEQIVTADHKQRVNTYRKAAQAKSDIERQETNREKTGVFTGAYAINPASDEKIPVWIADYVLMGYGTGAIMAVPAHDERDHEFAEKFNLPIIPVVSPSEGKYLVIEKSISSEAAKKLPEFGEVVVESESEGWGKLWRVSVPLSNEEEFRAFLEAELLEKETGGWYADSMGTTNYVVFRGKSVNVTSAKDYEEFKALGQKIGIPEEQLDISLPTAVHVEGVMINSGPYDGLPSAGAREKIVADLAAKGVGQERVNYKMRDWLISRQRYWGAPIPIVHCPKDGTVAVPEDQLPVKLPEMEKFEPSGDGRSPLANDKAWVNTTCPKCGGPAERETDTMDGFACSSWYFLRFADPHNDEKPFSKDKVDFWLPVDDYIGGAEHAVMHLLYARFWTKVMHDQGLIDFDEPFTTLRNQGMILAPDGQKMSKSKGNTIEPGVLIDQGYGADAIRIMELFIGPWNQSANWSVEGMGGSFRFLQRVWTLVNDYLNGLMYKAPDLEGETEERLLRETNQVVKRVTEDIESMSFNTAIAALMEHINTLYKVAYGENDNLFDKYPVAWLETLRNVVKLLAPFAPHIADELWSRLVAADDVAPRKDTHAGSVHVTPWPEYDERYLSEDTMKIAIQVNGKLRGEIIVPSDAAAEQILEAAKADAKVAAHISDKEIRKSIYVPGRLVNFVV